MITLPVHLEDDLCDWGTEWRIYDAKGMLINCEGLTKPECEQIVIALNAAQPKQVLVAGCGWKAKLEGAEAALARTEELVEALRELIRGYVLLLENGRDRILFLGGQCDDVETMEHNDQCLKQARAAVARHEKGAL